MRKNINPLRLFVGGILCLLAGIAVWQATALHFTEVAYRASSSAEWITTTHPVKFTDESETYLVNLSFTKRSWHPETFQLVADDCVEELHINGRTVEDGAIPFCDYNGGRFLNLADYLELGTNQVYASIRNDGGNGFVRLQVPTWAGAYTTARLLIVIGLLLTATGVIWSYSHTVRFKILAGIFMLGATLRLVYTAFTTYYQRGHDVDGHLSYISYFTQNFAIPEASAGWLFYHPPLYYWLNATVWRLANFWQLSDWHVYELIQLLSLAIGLATLAVALWIGALLFKRSEQTGHLVAYGLLVSIIPSFIFLAARINNDALVQFFMFLSCALLLKWWQAKEPKWWYLSLGVIALGILTKTNAVLMLPVAYGLLALNRSLDKKIKIRLGALGAGLLVLMTGWFFAIRFGLEDGKSIVGNSHTLPDRLAVNTEIKSLTTFNPVAVVQTPFNNPWDDAARRNNFWEYLWRSAFFGEFRFEKLRIFASAIMLFSVLLIPFVIKGLWHSLRRYWYELLPIILTFGALALGHAAIRQKEAFASTQDFRYSILLIVPMAVFLVMGMQNEAKDKLRNTPMYLCIALILSCVALITGITWAYS